MKQHLTTLFTFSSLLIIILGAGCNKSSDTTGVLGAASSYNVVGAITTNSAQIYSVVNANGNASTTAAGVCWSSANQSPTLSDSKTSNTIDTVSFISNLTALAANTTYYARAYITNNAGTAYGNLVTFKTNTTTYALTATVSTLSGTGATGLVNGTGLNAQFYNPQGVCVDAQGNVYVADAVNSVIRKVTPAGLTTTYAGTGVSGYTDGPALSAQFYAPKAVAADAQGNIYVADYGNSMIRKITAATGVVSTLAGRYVPGYVDATGSAAAFRSPSGLAVDAQGNVYVADRDNNAIRMITPAGVVSTLAGNVSQGQLDATGTAAYFNGPSSIAIDAQGNLYVTDVGNYSVRKITSAGVVTTVVGNYLLKARVFTASGICVDSKGNIFISDANGRILEISAANSWFPLAGVLNVTGFVNGTNASAAFNSPQSVAVDTQGNIYVADYYNNMIRKIVVTSVP